MKQYFVSSVMVKLEKKSKKSKSESTIMSKKRDAAPSQEPVAKKSKKSTVCILN